MSKRPASPLPASPHKRAPIVAWLLPHYGGLHMHRDLLTDEYEEDDFMCFYDAWRHDELGEKASPYGTITELDAGWCIAHDPSDTLYANQTLHKYRGPLAIFRREESSNSLRPLPSIQSLKDCDSFREAIGKKKKYQPLYWSNKGKFQKELDTIFQSELVPGMGLTKDRDLNYLLEWNHLYYRCYNDGEVVVIRERRIISDLCKYFQIDGTMTTKEKRILYMIMDRADDSDGGYENNLTEMEDPHLASLLDKVMDWIVERLVTRNADVKKLLQ